MCVICKQSMHVLYVLDWVPLYGMSAITVIPTFMEDAFQELQYMSENTNRSEHHMYFKYTIKLSIN